MGKIPLNEADWKSMLRKRASGKTPEQIAAQMELSAASIRTFFRVYDAVGEDKWEYIKTAINGNQSLNLIEFCARNQEKMVPEDIIEAYKNHRENANSKQKGTRTKKDTQNTSEEVNEETYFFKIYEQQLQQTELLEFL